MFCSSIREASVMSLKVVSKSPVYHGSATSRSRPVYDIISLTLFCGSSGMMYVLRIIRNDVPEPAQVHTVHIDYQVKPVIIRTCYLPCGLVFVKRNAVCIKATLGGRIDGIPDFLRGDGSRLYVKPVFKPT